MRQIDLGARGVDHQKQPLAQIGHHQVVDDAAGLVGEQRVALPARMQPGDVAHRQRLQRRDRARPGERRLPHMRHVEQAAASRVWRCSAMMPAGYCTGSTQPANGTMRAPSRSCRAASGVALGGGGISSGMISMGTVWLRVCGTTRLPQRAAGRIAPPSVAEPERFRACRPYSVGADGASRRRPAFQRLAPKLRSFVPERFRGPVAPSAAGSVPALSRTGDVRTGGRMVAPAALCNRNRDHIIPGRWSGGCRRVPPSSAGSRHRGDRRRRSWCW